MPMRATTTSSSPRCSHFSCNRGGDHAHALGQSCCRPLGRAAGFLGGGIAAAFFASLERCSCVEFPTDDDDQPLSRVSLSRDVGEAAPLLPRATAAAKKSRKSTTAVAGKGKISRGGFGCCDNTTAAN